MIQRTRFVGMDVHKATIAVAVAEEGAVAPESHSTIANDPCAVRKLFRQLGGEGITLRAAYEAGPTGFAVHRQLHSMGVDCVVVAPSLFPRRPGDRVKTDRRDALNIARLFRSGDLTPVWIPTEEDEALRDLVRARAAARTDLLRAKHRLSKLLLTKGIAPPAGTRAWTAKYRQWLQTIDFPHRPAQVVFADYRREVEGAEDRVRRLEKELWSCAEQNGQIRTIAALQALRGIGFISAVTIVAEAGDLRRFAGARQFMSYTGLVASEHSSGSSTYRGHITHTGNALLRHIVGEAAHHYRHPPSRQGNLKQRQEGLPPDIVDLAWKAQHRLHSRYRHLSARLGRPKAITAVSRELAGFIWALGRLVANEEAAAA